MRLSASWTLAHALKCIHLSQMRPVLKTQEIETNFTYNL